LQQHALALPAWIGITIGWSVAGTALWKGGWSERVAAVGFVLAWLATPLTRDHRWVGPQWSGFAIDVLFLAVLLVIALRTRRYWPLFAAAFQLLAVFTHLARIIDPAVGGWAYITAGVIWTYLTLFAIAYGTYNRWRERRQLAASGLAMAEPGATRR
jgi:hypothetical protein